ncbi:MAG: 23S rRNA (guanosine(2251)-2'-O)-methyltransferase RlmB [Pseudomonadales bacterium]|nr:23S rRNA (guanosine(2251)-2'-O)-methyltransferase RlmB [Pseudomonadales bacterium]MCP5216492.1 23S rRNA (guanosine(2251)-2'-O)-methyltransferase RlmB [Pseudomonadales bacterium]
MTNDPETKSLVYGFHPVQALLQRSPERIEQLWVQNDKFNSRIRQLLKVANHKQVPVLQVEREELDTLVDGNHQGVAARCAARQEFDEGYLEDLLDNLELAPLLLVLDGVTDPHNLGACLRTADAAGVNAVIVPKDNSAPITSTVSKVSSGAAETLPFVRVTNLARTLKWLQARGLWITGAAVDESAQVLYCADLTGPRVLVMGSEGKGMRRLTRETCDELVYIPMAGEVSSLNVSVATGVCLFEAVRQRSQPQK